MSTSKAGSASGGKTAPAPRIASIKVRLPPWRWKYKTRSKLNNDARMVVESNALEMIFKNGDRFLVKVFCGQFYLPLGFSKVPAIFIAIGVAALVSVSWISSCVFSARIMASCHCAEAAGRSDTTKFDSKNSVINVMSQLKNGPFI